MYKENDVVLSSRVRFARNLKDYPYVSRLDKNGALEIIEKVKGALDDSYVASGFDKLGGAEAMSYTENHSVSREFAQMTLPHELFEKSDTKLMVCEEDHIRLQVIKKGFMVEESYNEAIQTDKILLEKLKIDYSERLGYLTHCPTNLGTGMRVSVMLFLPGLYLTRRLKSIIMQLDKLGLTIRGMYGEGSEAGAYIYQISNRETLGISEEKIISKLKDIVSQIIGYERDARNELKINMGIELADKISRAYGILKFAKKITSKEFTELYAKVRLGICIGIIKETELETLDKLFSDVMPYSLCVYSKKKLNEKERDIARSEYIQNIL